MLRSAEIREREFATFSGAMFHQEQLRLGSVIHSKRFRVFVPEPLFRAVEMFEIVPPERFRFFNDGLPIHCARMPVNLRRSENRKVKRLKKLALRFHVQKESIRLIAFSPP